jgi:hypothetical protein
MGPGADTKSSTDGPVGVGRATVVGAVAAVAATVARRPNGSILHWLGVVTPPFQLLDDLSHST